MPGGFVAWLHLQLEKAREAKGDRKMAKWLTKFTQVELAEVLMHKETGSVATLEEWLDSYGSEELEARSLTLMEAVSEDLYVTLFPVVQDATGEWIAKKY